MFETTRTDIHTFIYLPERKVKGIAYLARSHEISFSAEEHISVEGGVGYFHGSDGSNRQAAAGRHVGNERTAANGCFANES